jgi:hypothetical protein
MGIWPSSEHMPIFARFREAIGERRGLSDAPGHIVTLSDRDDAVSVLSLALLFFWDCHVLSGDGHLVFSCSHDEWCAFLLPPRQDRSGLADMLAKWTRKR